MKRADYEAMLEHEMKRYQQAQDPATIKLRANTIFGLDAQYIKSIRFALAKAFQKIEDLESRR